MSIALGLGLATAQQAAPATAANHHKTAKTAQALKPAKPAATATSAKAEAAAPAVAKMKKDGTPDKRYKENEKRRYSG